MSRRCSAAQDCTLTVFLHYVHLRLPIQLGGPVIDRNTLMTLQLLGISDGQEAEYRELVNHLVAWCGENNPLILNTNKTREIIVDFRRIGSKPNTISILGEEVGVMEEY